MTHSTTRLQLESAIAAPARYVLTLVLLTLAVLAATMIMNRLVDPYRLFSVAPAGELTRYPALYANMRLHKARQIDLQRPDAVVLGTSRAVQGIPMEHAFFAESRLYNLAVPLASMEENTRLLEHALSNGPVHKLLLVVDFLSFNVLANNSGPLTNFVPERLSRLVGRRARRAPDTLAALLSFDALKASVEVVRAGGSGQRELLTGSGGRTDANIRQHLADGGHRSNTLRIEDFFMRAAYLPAPRRAFAFADGTQDAFVWFDAFVRLVHQHDIDATIVIGPSHARLFELVNVAGLWPRYEEWKRQLVESNERVATESADDPVPLWDFTMPDAITTEAFPEAGNTVSEMRFYYEAVHFNQRAGALMLQRLMSDEQSPDHRQDTVLDETAIDFGVRLDSNNLERVLESIRTRQARFRAAHPLSVQEHEETVRNAVGTRP